MEKTIRDMRERQAESEEKWMSCERVAERKYAQVVEAHEASAASL